MSDLLSFYQLLEQCTAVVQKKFNPIRVVVNEKFGEIRYTPDIPIFVDPDRQWIGVRIKRKDRERTAGQWLHQYSHVLCDETLSPPYYHVRKLTMGFRNVDSEAMIKSTIGNSMKTIVASIKKSWVAFDVNYALVRLMQADEERYIQILSDITHSIKEITGPEQLLVANIAQLKGYNAEELTRQFSQVRKNIDAAKRMI